MTVDFIFKIEDLSLILSLILESETTLASGGNYTGSTAGFSEQQCLLALEVPGWYPF